LGTVGIEPKVPAKRDTRILLGLSTAPRRDQESAKSQGPRSRTSSGQTTRIRWTLPVEGWGVLGAVPHHHAHQTDLDLYALHHGHAFSHTELWLVRQAPGSE
jgi:hypothetical protein